VVSDWSQFSGFTYYTEGQNECVEDCRPISGDVSVKELEEIVKNLDLEVKLAVMEMHGMMVDLDDDNGHDQEGGWKRYSVGDVDSCRAGRDEEEGYRSDIEEQKDEAWTTDGVSLAPLLTRYTVNCIRT
jgi:hypothetical protein